MKKSWRITCMALVLILGFSTASMAQHPVGQDGFFYETGPLNDADFPIYYELTRDYTIDLPSYFLDTSDLPEGASPESRQGFFQIAVTLNPAEWDFIRLEKGGILTIKKGYRWDGASRPCKPDCEEYDFHYRPTVVHDALYDLMRLGYLEPDKTHWERGELPYRGITLEGWITKLILQQFLEWVVHSRVECYDDEFGNTRGDHNRLLADLMLYMISVEDGQDPGKAETFAALANFGGACRTYDAFGDENAVFTSLFNEQYRPPWKFHPSDLTAHRSTAGVQLKWRIADIAGIAPEDNEYQTQPESTSEYVIFRNGVKLLDAENQPITVLTEATEFLDNTVEEGQAYLYELKGASLESEPRYWSNQAGIVWTDDPGTAMRLGFEGFGNFVRVGNAITNDLVYWNAPGWHEPIDAALLPNLTLLKETLRELYTPDAFTAEAWILPDEQSDNVAIFSFDYPVSLGSDFFNPASLHLAYCGSTSKFCIIWDDHSGNDPYIIPSREEFQPGQWYHVALTASRDVQGGFAVYVNGELQGGFLPTWKVAPWRWASLNIGGSQTTEFVGTFRGLMDEARVWKTARSLDEIQAGMCSTTLDSEPDLVSLWHFDAPIQALENQCLKFLSKYLCFAGAADATRNANHLLAGTAADEPKRILTHSGAITPVPAPARVELDSLGTGFVTGDELLANTTNDFCAKELGFVSSAEFSCSDLGLNKLDIEITDKADVTRDAQVDVEVVDLLAPDVRRVVPSHRIINSADGEMVKVSIDDVLAPDNCDEIALDSCEIVSVSADESLVEGVDYEFIDSLAVNLSTTSLSAAGRMYSIGVTCTDASNRVSEPGLANVRVNPAKQEARTDGGIGAVSIWFLLGLVAGVAWRSRVYGR